MCHREGIVSSAPTRGIRGIREVSLEEVRTEMGLEGWTGIDWLETLERKGTLRSTLLGLGDKTVVTGQLRPED